MEQTKRSWPRWPSGCTVVTLKKAKQLTTSSKRAPFQTSNKCLKTPTIWSSSNLKLNQWITDSVGVKKSQSKTHNRLLAYAKSSSSNSWPSRGPFNHLGKQRIASNITYGDPITTSWTETDIVWISGQTVNKNCCRTLFVQRHTNHTSSSGFYHQHRFAISMQLNSVGEMKVVNKHSVLGVSWIYQQQAAENKWDRKRKCSSWLDS